MADPRALATDGVVFLDGGVVLPERGRSPHGGDRVLPGGLVERGNVGAAYCCVPPDDLPALGFDHARLVAGACDAHCPPPEPLFAPCPNTAPCADAASSASASRAPP